jgi:glycosyltransferase involved in cell wall biosynthesis
MAGGTPAIVSTAASLPEVCGDGAAYVDPTSPDSIASAMLRLLRDAGERARLIERGRAHVRTFTWDSAAGRTRDLLARLLGTAVGAA